jgi:hypothetical protein
MILVQQYLLEHSLADLAAEHAVGATLSASGHKASLNYNMIEAKDGDPIACQCRGLVIARESGQPIALDAPLGSTIILARPFDRFFNHGQGAAADIDFSDPTTVFMEKRDGTLGIPYLLLPHNFHRCERLIPRTSGWALRGDGGENGKESEGRAAQVPAVHRERARGGRQGRADAGRHGGCT